MEDIELVIKIPENVYKASQIIDVKYEDVIQIPLEVIKNGTPLPKGHGRLIDANNLHSILDCHMYNIDGIHKIIDTDEDIKTIIEADTESENK